MGSREGNDERFHSLSAGRIDHISYRLSVREEKSTNGFVHINSLLFAEIPRQDGSIYLLHYIILHIYTEYHNPDKIHFEKFLFDSVTCMQVKGLQLFPGRTKTLPI